MREFGFHTPTTLPDAFELLDTIDAGAKLLAGGTDLLLQMRKGERAPRTLISLKRIPELRGMDYSPRSGLHLGAYSTLNEIARSSMIHQNYPCLAATVSVMASVQVRNLATVGGNLCNASPSADLAPPLIALDATVHLASAERMREMPLEAFFTGPGETALRDHEILTHLSIPPPRGRTLYFKHTPRTYMDPAVIGVAARVDQQGGVVEEARLVLGAVAPTPLRAHAAEEAVLGTELQDESIEEAARLASDATSPISDIRGSQAYRSRMVEVQVRRALQSLRSAAAAQVRA